MPNTSSGASSSSASNRVHQVVDEIHESEVKIVKKLGEGTTSIVYLGRYNGEEVAIKQLRQADEIEDVSSRQFLQSDFENELVINMQILHKYVVKLVGYILNRKQKRLKSLVFECCHGKVLNCNDYYSLKDSLCIGVQIANALAYVHSLGIIHRDLKPSQVIITRDKGNQIVSKLGDWGLSTTTNFQNVEFTSIVGTLEFMAPEILWKRDYNCSVDTFSFGIFLYCLVYNQNYPYYDHYLTPEQSALAVAKKDLRPMLNSSVPESIRQILRMCWTSEVSLRPSMEVVEIMLQSELDKLNQ